MAGMKYFARNIVVDYEGDVLSINTGSIKVVYNLETGITDIFRVGARDDAPALLKHFYAEVEIDGRKINNTGLTRDDDSVSMQEFPANSKFAPGVKMSVKNTGPSLTLWQNFYILGTKPYILLETVAESAVAIETNYIAPLAGAEVELEGAKDPRFLFVPFDNDAFIRYSSDRLGSAKPKESYEVTAIYDEDVRGAGALVVGSVTHDVWKTGISAEAGGTANGLRRFRAYGGVSSKDTRDVLPHGSVSGQTIVSPQILVGYYADWRDGMEEYGAANGFIAPPLKWDAGPPFGWNSWSAVADKVDYDVYVKASDFFKSELPKFSNNGVVYINFDSFWDRLTEDERKAAAAHVKANGQKPGIYYTPFTYWGKPEQAAGSAVPAVEGLTYADIVLKDPAGNILTYPSGAGGVPIDPSHPGNIARVNAQLHKFIEWGFEYVKLDFMCHGSMEGVHYEPGVTTGIQAYNYGMQKMLEGLAPLIDEQKFFISLSIAPTFPAQYAHGRRVSCDVFGTIDQAEYMLNSLTYGWWLNGAVYPVNDPDHIVVWNSYNHKDAILFNEGLTRFVSSAIAGAFMIDSDDIRIAEARERLKEIFRHEAVYALAAAGRTFRPVYSAEGGAAADAFVRKDGEEEEFYLAVFNYSPSNAKKLSFDLGRLGLEQDRVYRITNLLDNSALMQNSSEVLSIDLAPAEPVVYKLMRG
ncbi:alpha-galactosidase [Spirochaetia bacterium]|nr:alpha-galactosidase [Spirochaetia bacterium]